MTVRTSPRRLVRDTATEQHAHGRNSAFPSGHLARRSIVSHETAELGDLSDDELCSLADDGTLHCRVMSKMIGRARPFSDYAKAHAALLVELNNKGPGTASEIVAEMILGRVGVPVLSRSRLGDMIAGGRHIEVKSSYEDSRCNARKGHQVVIQQTQLAKADYLLAALLSGPGADNGTISETEIRWVFAPMPVVAQHVATRLSGQLHSSYVTMHFRPTPARETFGSYTHHSASSLLRAVSDALL